MGTIKHIYNQTVADGTATSVVRPSDWNSAHNYTMQDAISVSAGNTTGTLTVMDSGTFYIAGGNNITLSQNGNSVTWSALASSVLTGADGLSVSSNGSTMSVRPVLASEYLPWLDAASLVTNSTLGQSSLYFFPFDVEWPVSASRINFFMSVGTSVTGINSTGTGSQGFGYALYTRGTGASSERISQLTSYSLVWASWSFSSNSQLRITHYNGLSNATSHSTGSTALSTSNASTYLATSIGGYRVMPLPLNQTLTPGRYWIGISVQSTTANATAFSIQASVLQQTYGNNIAYRPLGVNSAASNASVWGVFPGIGTYSAQSAGWPNSIALTNSDIKMPPSITMPFFNISGISTATNIL